MADTPTGTGSNGGTTTVVSNPPNLPTVNTVPNTTTDAEFVEYQTSVSESVFDPRQDPAENIFDPGATFNGPAAQESVFDPRQDVGESVFDPGATFNGPAAQESVFDPRQDIGESVFDPGATFNGPATEESVFDPRQDIGESVFDPAGANPNPSLKSAAQLNDPLFGLTSKQIQSLGGADPTDPFIRARLGIPQLPGATVAAVGFNFSGLTTGFSAIDKALGTIGKLFSGFGGKTTKQSATKTGTTTGEPVPTPNTAAVAQDATKILAQDTALTDDEDQNLQNIVGAQGEIGRAEENIQSNNRQISANEQAQAAALEQQRQAQAIIDQNNAELADDTLPDSRRAELEANNAAQYASIAENAAVIDEAQNNIDSATANNDQQTDSILTNQGVIAQNSDGFAANIEGAGPTEVSALEDPGAAAAESVFDPGQTFNADGESVFNPGAVDPAQDIGEQVFDPGETINAGEESVFDPANVEPNSDPFEEARYQALLAADVPANEIVLTPDEQAAADDPFEARRLELEQEANREQLALEATDVEPGLFTGQTDEFGGVDGAVAIEQADIDTRNDPALSEEEIQAEIARAAAENVELSPEDVDAEIARAAAEGAEQYEPTDVNTNEDDGLPQDDGTTEGIQDQINDQEASNEAAVRNQAKQQATIQARYKQPGNKDWRVRLSLSPGAQYLYNANPPGILAPLKANGGTDGVIFPYTPQISTTYSASYEQYDLTHSNFRGLFYKSSRVGDISLRGTFTAQDTTEANYLLAVIHFFRSATKMFYGQDAQRGTPPPICLLNGFGGYQFSDHPVVISSFNYTLPNDCDYIRTTNPNNFGLNLANRYNASATSLPAGGALAGYYRLLNAIPGGLKKGAVPTVPAPNEVSGSVTNNTPASYVPTKMEIDITLIPVQTRSQVSQQFSLKGFANGDLLKGGFW